MFDILSYCAQYLPITAGYNFEAAELIQAYHSPITGGRVLVNFFPGGIEDVHVCEHGHDKKTEPRKHSERP